jgi:sterol 3beta-glucosyltransferase
MRVTVFSIGTQGDVRPFVALGRGLLGAGHSVRIATSPEFAPLVTGAGLDFVPLTANFRDIMAREPDAMMYGLNPLRVAEVARRRLVEAAPAWVEQGRAAAGDAHLVIGTGISTLLADAVAEALNKPFVQAQIMPMTPAPDLPPMMLTPPRRPLPGPVNLLLYQALRLLTWRIMSPAMNGVVRRGLGLRPHPWYGPYFTRNAERRRILYAYSGHVVPKPASWSGRDAVTGYWYYDEAVAWQPPDALARFLEAGPKPVYVGFGSMVSRDAEAFTREVLGALERSGRRAVLALGWGGLAHLRKTLDESRHFVIEQAPHDWLFPRMALAVHHGGAGTTAAAVRAGIPSVIVPFFGDQPFWAWSLLRLGVAPPTLDRQRLTAAVLATAIAAAGEKAMRDRAAALGRRVRSEDGVATAIETLQEWGLLPGGLRHAAAADFDRPAGLVGHAAAGR